jgi:hypothetical protein
VLFAGDGFTHTPMCALNSVAADVSVPLDSLRALPQKAVVVSGAATRGAPRPATGAGRVIVGHEDPNGRVSGDLGDIYQRIDAPPGPRLFIKETDGQSITGWIAK